MAKEIGIKAEHPSFFTLHFQQFFCCDAEFIVPFFAEASDEGFSQELVEADAAFCAEADGVLADVPAMVVKACQRA